ncbi:MAG: hypothetical protein RL215_419, partial [Planctomycetota bacterium]
SYDFQQRPDCALPRGDHRLEGDWDSPRTRVDLQNLIVRNSGGVGQGVGQGVAGCQAALV